MPLRIGQGDMAHIHDHAKATYPEECSGVMVGMNADGAKVVVDIWRAANTHEDERSRRFLIDPKEYIAFEKHADERDMEILGVYHSHPDHPAEPSEYDRDHAWPGWSYVITSVSGDEIKDTRSWLLKPDRDGYDEEEIIG